VRAPQTVDTAVIGAGQAGLSMSWELTRAGREHVVLDARDTLGGGWQDRWDEFCLVTPNWSAALRGRAHGLVVRSTCRVDAPDPRCTSVDEQDLDNAEEGPGPPGRQPS